jgi:hypothetical protein
MNSATIDSGPMVIRVGVRVVVMAMLVNASASAFAADIAPPPFAPHLDPHDRALALELQRMWTIHPEELVTVLGAAARNDRNAPPLSLLLAIAHAETSGDVLDISEAGAVGLAQATPVALRQEGFEGKLYVSADYLAGARAYMLKKPLHDVEVIAGDVLEDSGEESWRDAKSLLESARALRRESVDELDLLAPWADMNFFDAVRADDARNLDLLDRLSAALESRDKRALRTLRDLAHDEYRASLSRQQASWKRYQLDLAAQRDALLQSRFGMRPSVARKQRSYEAGELLAEELDVRFSPTRMAEFLVRHLERKSLEAERLASSPEKHEEMTAALYNGGAHNVKRMMAGLITWLPETENYARKVPATRRRLDGAAAGIAEFAQVPGGEIVETPFR